MELIPTPVSATELEEVAVADVGAVKEHWSVAGGPAEGEELVVGW